MDARRGNLARPYQSRARPRSLSLRRHTAPVRCVAEDRRELRGGEARLGPVAVPIFLPRPALAVAPLSGALRARVLGAR